MKTDKEFESAVRKKAETVIKRKQRSLLNAAFTSVACIMLCVITVLFPNQKASEITFPDTGAATESMYYDFTHSGEVTDIHNNRLEGTATASKADDKNAVTKATACVVIMLLSGAYAITFEIINRRKLK